MNELAWTESRSNRRCIIIVAVFAYICNAQREHVFERRLASSRAARSRRAASRRAAVAARAAVARARPRSHMVAGVGKAKKNAYIAFLRDAVSSDATFADALAKTSKDYTAWAKLCRERGRGDAAHADALRLLDSKGHLLNILDRACEVGESSNERLKKVAEAWEKTKKVQRAKFEKSGGAQGVAEARLRKREAKERINASRKEREARESKAKEKKAARLEYATKVHEARSAGECLDWLNMGRCRFGGECQFTHDPMSKGMLKQLAITVGAETGDVKRERNLAEKAERKARVKALKEANAGGDDDDVLGGHSSSSDDDRSEDESEDDMPGFLKIERARRAAEALLSTNKVKKDGGKAAAAAQKKTKHFNKKQLERKQKFLKEGRNQPLIKKGLKRAPTSGGQGERAKKMKKPRHIDSARKKARVGKERTFFGEDD